MAEGYSNKTNFSWDRQLRFDGANQPSNSSYTMRRGSRNRNGSHSEHSRQQRPVCRFFRRGACQYGERCRFAHPEPSAALAPEAASTSSTGSASPAKLEESATASPHSFNDKWVEAPEFVPSASKSAKTKSYADVLSPPETQGGDGDTQELKLCPYAELHGVCSYPEGECLYTHGDICEYCGNAALHPNNEGKRNEHTASCVQQHERNMELSFAVARSKDKSCGVCFEIVMEKSSREQRFGILPNCNHVFCLSCIRKWRQAKQFDNKIIRACPECRVSSDFVCPSMFWVDTKEEKEKLIKDYKVALAQKNCKYFKQGRGKCPFGNKCFYLHALPDGTKTDVGPPPRQPRRQNHDGDIDMLQVGECDRHRRTQLISCMIRVFNGYPTETTQFNYGTQRITVECTELADDVVVVHDDNDFSMETLISDSGVDVQNGFLFSFVRQIEVSSVQYPATFTLPHYNESNVDSTSTTDDNLSMSEEDDDSMFDVNYDSDDMGEPLWGLKEPVDEQFFFSRAERRQRYEARWAEQSRQAAEAGLDNDDHSAHYYASCEQLIEEHEQMLAERARLIAEREEYFELIPLSELMSPAEHFDVLTKTISAFFNPDADSLVPYWAFEPLRIDYRNLIFETGKTVVVDEDSPDSESSLSIQETVVIADIVVHTPARFNRYTDRIMNDAIQNDVDPNAQGDDGFYPDENGIYVDRTTSITEQLSTVDIHGDANRITCGSHHHKMIRKLRNFFADDAVSLDDDTEVEGPDTMYTIVEPETEAEVEEVAAVADIVELAFDEYDDEVMFLDDDDMVDLDHPLYGGYAELPQDLSDYMGNRQRHRYRYVFRLMQGNYPPTSE